MINEQDQPSIVVRAEVILPDRVSFVICKELECIRGKEVLDEGKDERDEILMRPVKWSIEKLGDELFSCFSFLVSRAEIRKGFGLDGEGLFNPDETEKELKIEARVPPGVREEMLFLLGAIAEVAFAKVIGYDTSAIPFSQN